MCTHQTVSVIIGVRWMKVGEETHLCSTAVEAVHLYLTAASVQVPMHARSITTALSAATTTSALMVMMMMPGSAHVHIADTATRLQEMLSVAD